MWIQVCLFLATLTEFSVYFSPLEHQCWAPVNTDKLCRYSAFYLGPGASQSVGRYGLYPRSKREESVNE